MKKLLLLLIIPFLSFGQEIGLGIAHQQNFYSSLIKNNEYGLLLFQIKKKNEKTSIRHNLIVNSYNIQDSNNLYYSVGYCKKWEKSLLGLKWFAGLGLKYDSRFSLSINEPLNSFLIIDGGVYDTFIIQSNTFFWELSQLAGGWGNGGFVGSIRISIGYIFN
tara:strand:- start:76 stop:561 length:486 start_codon:yes stop_codon:yes gene_type:complete